MSKIITPKQRQVSQETFAKHPEVFKAFMKKYKTKTTALEASEHKLHEVFYTEEGILPPLISTMIDEIYNYFDGESTAAPQQLIQSRDAVEFETWIIDLDGTAQHAKEHRKTREVTLRPADPLSNYCAEYEATIPGFTYFVGGLISLYDSTGDYLQTWSEEAGYSDCSPSPYKYRGLLRFLGDYQDSLFVKMATGSSAFNACMAMVERVANLSLPDYLELSSAFFYLATGITEAKFMSTLEEHPFRLIGHSLVKGQRFFKYHSAAGIDPARAKHYVYQTGPWRLRSMPPTTVEEAFKGLQNSRVHRRENGKGYGSLTNGHQDGGELTEERVHVTNALSLAIPLLREQDIEIRVPSPLTASHVDKALTKRSPKHTWKFVMNVTQAMAAFPEDHKSKYVAARTGGVLLLDLETTAPPTFAKNTNMAKVWAKHYEALLPQAPYIVFRKVPPQVADTQLVYRMGTMHAFDALVTSLPKLRGVGRKYTLNHGVLTFVEEDFDLESFKTSAAYLQAQWADDRRKLEMFFTVNQRVKFSTALNLWTPPPVTSKKNRVALEYSADGKYQIDGLDADFAEDFQSEDEDEDDFGADFEKAPAPQAHYAPLPVKTVPPPKPFVKTAVKTVKAPVKSEKAPAAQVPVAQSSQTTQSAPAAVQNVTLG